MKLTNKDVVDIYTGLNNMRTGRSEALPVKIGFQLIHALKILEPTAAAINETRDMIIKQYGQQNEDNTYYIPSEHIDTVQKQLIELGEIESEFNISYIPLSELSNFSFSLDDIDLIYPIINGEA